MVSYVDFNRLKRPLKLVLDVPLFCWVYRLPLSGYNRCRTGTIKQAFERLMRNAV